MRSDLVLSWLIGAAQPPQPTASLNIGHCRCPSAHQCTARFHEAPLQLSLVLLPVPPQYQQLWRRRRRQLKAQHSAPHYLRGRQGWAAARAAAWPAAQRRGLAGGQAQPLLPWWLPGVLHPLLARLARLPLALPPLLRLPPQQQR